MVKSGIEFFILKFTKPLQICCCPVQKKLPKEAKLACQVGRYLWRGSVNFKTRNSRPLFTPNPFLAKNGNFKTQNFSPHIVRVLAGLVFKRGLFWDGFSLGTWRYVWNMYLPLWCIQYQKEQFFWSNAQQWFATLIQNTI